MKIIADENIPCAAQAFETLGEVTLLPGREMVAEQVRDADILLVRSVTRVNRSLLKDSRVSFVGSVTIGFDHIDREYLDSRGIGFSTAPGSNATSAAEYILSALMVLSARDDFRLAERSAGIIGCGNVGSRVRSRLSALGVECMVNDPPLKERGGHEDFVELDDLLQADILTVHVPFQREGAHPTFHLIDAALMKRMRPGTIMINTARGAVLDNLALNRLLAEGRDLSVVLDVWENEPAINTSLLERVSLGTPHIAGYSLDGKLRGTEMIYRAVCEYLGLPAQWHTADLLQKQRPLELDGVAGGVNDRVRAAVLSCYDIRHDDEHLRAILNLEAGEQPAFFDRLRREYPVRREFSEMPLVLQSQDRQLADMLRGIGFEVSVSAELPSTSSLG